VSDVALDAAHAATLTREPLIVADALEAFLDLHGLGAGPLRLAPLGDGHSNVTYAVSRAGLDAVLRRPPRGPLPPSAHNVVREARLLSALHAQRIRVPAVLAICEADEVIGAPFFVMERVAGRVLAEPLPDALGVESARRRVGPELVDALAEIHAVAPVTLGPAFARGERYLERQLERFTGLLEANATRPLPALDRVSEWLAAERPASRDRTLVHGDFRLGNVLFSPEAPAHLLATLDWELAACGDPLADLGYLTATWMEPGDAPNPMLALSSVTALEGFSRRDELVRRYADRTGRDVSALRWYQALALWKAAIFLECSYRRFLAGSTDDPYFGTLAAGVPALADAALEHTSRRL
jgi:aminoglycoside phosphotransferase (APT) family kinase protein